MARQHPRVNFHARGCVGRSQEKADMMYPVTEQSAALLNAFNRGELTRMVRFHLSVRLDQISNAAKLADVVFDLVE